jgi:hypothetical protein
MKYTKLPGGLLILVASALASWNLTEMLIGPAQATQSYADPIRVTSAQEASVVAKYEVATPQVPSGFVRSEYISIINFENASLSPIVHFRWTLEEDRSVWLVFYNAPDNTGLVEEEPGQASPIMIGNAKGEKIVYGVENEQRPHRLLALSWGDEQNAYVIYATLGGPLTEQAVMEIAATVAVR